LFGTFAEKKHPEKTPGCSERFPSTFEAASFINPEASFLPPAFSPQVSSVLAPSLEEAPPALLPPEEAYGSAADAHSAQELPDAEQACSGWARLRGALAALQV
jgi:hypothetical protein